MNYIGDEGSLGLINLIRSVHEYILNAVFVLSSYIVYADFVNFGHAPLIIIRIRSI